MTVPGLRLLFVCTANQCRSPMAEVIGRAELERRAIPAAVASSGTEAVDGAPATDGAQAAVARLGLDLSAHRSRRLTAELVEWADLTLVMERAHLLLIGTELGGLSSTFTLPELARLARDAEPRTGAEGPAEWAARLSTGRDHNAVLSAPEVADPIGRSKRHYRAAAALIHDDLVTVLDAYAGSGAPAAG